MKPAHVFRILVSFMNSDTFDYELHEGLEPHEYERAKASAFAIKRGLLERIEKAEARSKERRAAKKIA